MEDRHRCDQEGTIAELRTNMKAAFQRLDEMRAISESITKITDSVHLLAVSVAKLAERMDITVERVDIIQKDISEIKATPADDFRYYKRQWIGGAIGVVIGMLITSILQGVLQ